MRADTWLCLIFFFRLACVRVCCCCGRGRCRYAASRILARWKSFLGVSYATTSMLKFMLITFFVVHIMACVWAWMGLNCTLPRSEKTSARLLAAAAAQPLCCG